jgi:hypothetical protein
MRTAWLCGCCGVTAVGTSTRGHAPRVHGHPVGDAAALNAAAELLTPTWTLYFISCGPCVVQVTRRACAWACLFAAITRCILPNTAMYLVL